MRPRRWEEIKAVASYFHRASPPVRYIDNAANTEWRQLSWASGVLEGDTCLDDEEFSVANWRPLGEVLADMR